MSEEQQQALLAELGMDVAPSTLVSELNSLGIPRSISKKPDTYTRRQGLPCRRFHTALENAGNCGIMRDKQA